MFWRGANADGAAAAMIAGSVCGFVFFLVNVVLGWTHLHSLYAAPILTVIDLLILAAVSAGPPRRRRRRGRRVHVPDFQRVERLGLPGYPCGRTTGCWRRCCWH